LLGTPGPFRLFHPHGRVAQLAEHSTLNRQVGGSIPPASTKYALWGSIPRTDRWIPQVCPSSLSRVPQHRTGAPCSHQRARISYYAALTTTTHAGFSQGKPHQVAQRHQPRQEIRDTWAENDGRSPPQPFVPDPTDVISRRTRNTFSATHTLYCRT
jgi:hypothetical protein